MDNTSKMELGKKDIILHTTAFVLTIALMLLASYIIFTSNATGAKMLFYLGIAFLLISSVAYVVHVLIAKKVMLARLRKLVSDIGYIGESGDLSYRIQLKGDDGLSWMADNMNVMLGSLQKHEGNYRSLFEQSNDAILIFDSGGSILDANSRACELLGYGIERLNEHNISDFSPEGNVPNAMDVLSETLERGSVNSEVQMKLPSGREIDVDISSSIIDKEDNIIQAIIRDITEKKRSEKALLDAKLEAEAASRTKSEFIAVMNHELRTPLTSILGFSDVMLEGMAGQMTEKQHHYLVNISKSGNHLLETINSILDLSKMEAGKMEVEFELFDVSVAFREVRNIIVPLAAKKNISLEVSVDSNLPLICADRLAFKQILYNLVGNATKFTPEGGNIAINGVLCGDMARFSVKDNGIGISRENHDAIFRVFTQVDSSHNRRYGGSGLGLSVAKKFVEMHDGKIWVESELGKGSDFYFEIPVNGQ